MSGNKRPTNTRKTRCGNAEKRTLAYAKSRKYRRKKMQKNGRIRYKGKRRNVYTEKQKDRKTEKQKIRKAENKKIRKAIHGKIKKKHARKNKKTEAPVHGKKKRKKHGRFKDIPLHGRIYFFREKIFCRRCGKDMSDTRYEDERKFILMTATGTPGEIRRFAEKNGIDVNSSAFYGETAGIVAARRGNPAVVDVLAFLGADLTKPNAKGETPESVAREGGDVCREAYERIRYHLAKKKMTKTKEPAKESTSSQMLLF